VHELYWLFKTKPVLRVNYLFLFCCQISTTAGLMNPVRTEERVKILHLTSTCARVLKDSLDWTAKWWTIPAPQPLAGMGEHVRRTEDSIIARVPQGGQESLVTSVSTYIRY